MFIQLATKNLKRSILIKQTYFFIFYRLNPRYFNITFFTSFIAKEILKYGVSSSTYKKKISMFYILSANNYSNSISIEIFYGFKTINGCE